MNQLDFWDEKPFIDAANILVAADEPLRALQLLENLPGYYRDNVPYSIFLLKLQIQSKLATPEFYSRQEMNPAIKYPAATHQEMKETLRFRALKEDVQNLNDQDIAPHILDIGPGTYWLPVCLKFLNLRFTYEGIGLCQYADTEIKKYLGDIYQASGLKKDGTCIAFAGELIEHLYNESDIAIECFRRGVYPRIIHISTPKYTWDTRKIRLNWQAFGDLGHLRTYTPNEFISVVSKMFPSYKLEINHNEEIMHIRGISTVSMKSEVKQ